MKPNLKKAADDARAILANASTPQTRDEATRQGQATPELQTVENALKLLVNEDNYLETRFDPCIVASHALDFLRSAVNAHAALVEAAKQVVDAVDNRGKFGLSDAHQALRAAIGEGGNRPTDGNTDSTKSLA